ncbi:SMI1/KNR4 family protein [Dickeya ananatis]|uniref:SMI1/KNR4 family protein n=1 Tax=Dickeya ananatis TaxID=3061286 RepID=UPI00388EB1B6
MGIEKQDLIKWENNEPGITVDVQKIHDVINKVEQNLSVKLPDEYKDYLILVGDQTSWPHEDCGYFLAKYNGKTIQVLMSVLFPTEDVIDSTKLLQESIYENRTLLSNGLIVIGCDYDDIADAYLVYDIRENSLTYQHVFHWRYYQDNLVVGDGLGLVAHSLKDFLHTPTSEDKL